MLKAAGRDQDLRRMRRREERQRSRQRAKERLLECLTIAEDGEFCVEELRMLGKMPAKPGRDPEHRERLLRAQSVSFGESRHKKRMVSLTHLACPRV